jgi:hypothetical protein
MNKKLMIGFMLSALITIAPIRSVDSSQAKPSILEKVFKKIQYTVPKAISLKALGYPRSTKRGTRRIPCSPKENLMAIVPDDVGLTSSSKPIVWLYSPYQGNQKECVLKGSLILRKISKVNNKFEEKQVGREISFNIPSSPDVFSVQLEEELERGSVYKWVATVHYDKDAAANPTTGGFIAFDQPISQSLTNDEERLVVIAKQGYWYDALNSLLTNGSQQKLDVFLKSGGLPIESKRLLKR